MNPQCEPIDHDAIAKRCKGGLAFLCLPHEAAMHHTPLLLARGVKVVDLSAAYRIKDAAVYEKAYGHPHTDAKNPYLTQYFVEWVVEEDVPIKFCKRITIKVHQTSLTDPTVAQLMILKAQTDS